MPDKRPRVLRNLGEKDCPKNAHLVGDWEDLDEEAKTKYIAINTSVTDQDDLSAILAMAQLADRDFTAEKQNVRVVDTGAKAIQLGNRNDIPEELKKLPIPVRPPWSKTMTAERVDRNEREAFLEWRRGLAEIEEKYDSCLTPFEKNLEFWRQLWRVVEKSDVIVQVGSSSRHLTQFLLVSEHDSIHPVQPLRFWFSYVLSSNVFLD